MLFKSSHPDIKPPLNLTTWQWLFASPSSPLLLSPSTPIAGFTNAVTHERISYSELKLYSTHLSTRLVKRYGLQPGETIALFAPNTIWYPVAMLAASRAGAIISGANPAYTVEEMAFALKTARARFLFTVEGSLDVALKAAGRAGMRRENVFLLEGRREGFSSVRELVEEGRREGEKGQVQVWSVPRGKTNRDVCGFLSFSSGTTGLPKAVMISHHNIIAQCLQIQPLTSPTHRRILAVLPSFHITGLVHFLHLPILLNADVYMLPSFTLRSMLDVVVAHRIQELLLVPPILIRMVRDPIVDEYDLSFVERFSSGAAPLSEEVIVLLREKFPWTGFKQGYGMTESTSCITAHPPDKTAYEYAHRVGAIVASTEVKIVDEAGRECGLREPGEVLARGPQIAMGYLGNEKATRETFLEDGWLRTGDQGVLDDEGMLRITDRIKEMVKVKGVQVAPAELEDCLLGDKSVVDCAVVGVLDEWAGERPKAFVVRRKEEGDGRGDAEGRRDVQLGRALFRYVKERKVREKWLKEVEFVDEIPKSASGKILRRVLREMRGRGTVVRDEEIRAKL